MVRARIALGGAVTRLPHVMADLTNGSGPEPRLPLTNRILIVDDHDVLASAVARAVRGRGFQVDTITGPTGREIVEEARRLAPVVVLLDLNLGAAGSGVDLVEPLARAGARVCVMSGTIDPAQVAACVEWGAVGVILKTAPLPHLLEAVERLTYGEDLVTGPEREAWHAEFLRQRRRLAPFASLTPRERAVLQLLMAGRTAEEVATETFVSLATVRSHIKSILHKLGVRTQLAAVALAFETGWPNDQG